MKKETARARKNYFENMSLKFLKLKIAILDDVKACFIHSIQSFLATTIFSETLFFT